jgi:hypothetical protein
VRDIFKWKLEGVSPQDIAVRLNNGGILSPLEYKKSLGMNYATPFQTNARAAWSAGNVLRILKNPVYTGVLTQGKETTPSYKVHKRISKPENEWSVIPDNHEAIISRADFDTVQKVLSMGTRRGIGDETVYLFSGMVFCGECGASMVRKTVPSGGKKYVYYVCSANKQDKSCSSHAIRDKELEKIVLTALQRYIREVIDMDTLLAMADTARLQSAEAQKLQRQIDVKRVELERLNKLLMSLYENLSDNNITRDEYARLKQNYSVRAEEAERHMNALQDALTDLREKGGSGKAWMEHFRRYENLTELDRSAVVSLVDRILVHEDKYVEIRYRWQDEFEWQLDILSRAAKEAV